jgi:hypothetical protein
MLSFRKFPKTWRHRKYSMKFVVEILDFREKGSPESGQKGRLRPKRSKVQFLDWQHLATLFVFPS